MQKPQCYHVIRNYQSPYPNPIVFHTGEEVEVGSELSENPDWKDWIWCEGEHENKAWAPKRYLKIHANRGIFITDYNAMELSVVIGETLKVHEIVNGFGMAEKSNGTRGWVPMRNLESKERE
jgi:hypothetical protein